jgi:hypothetical protein
VGADGTLTSISYRLGVAPGAGKSFLFVLYKNNTIQDGSGGTPDTQVTISESGTTGTWTGSLSLSAGDRIYASATPSGTPAATSIGSGCKFVATIDGESQYVGTKVVNLPGSAGDVYAPPNQRTAGAWETAEVNALVEHLGQSAFVLRTMRGHLDNTAANALTFSIRQNEGDPGGGPSATFSAGGTTATDTAGMVTIAPGDSITFRDSQTGSAGIARVGTWASVMYAVVGTVPNPDPGELTGPTPDPCCGGGSGTGPLLPPTVSTWTAICAGDGAVPTAADLTDAENWDDA